MLGHVEGHLKSFVAYGGGHVWVMLKVNLGSFFCHVGNHLESFVGHVGGHVWVMLRVSFGLFFGHVERQFGAMCGSCWGSFLGNFSVVLKVI